MRKLLSPIVIASMIITGAAVAPAADAQTKPASPAVASGVRPDLGKPSPGLEPLNPNPAEDPLYIDPEKNPFKAVSSSEMFLEWTDGMEEGEGKDFVQAWAAGSAVPDTANPVELLKQEIQGYAMMSSGLFTGDFEQSSRGSSQATSVILPVFIGVLVIGQIIELVMRGMRMATR